MRGRTLRIKATVQVIVGILLLVFLPLSIETFVAVFLLGSTAICAVVWIFVQNKTLLRVLLWLIPLTAIMQLGQLLGLVRYEFLSGENMPFWLSCLICTVSVMAVAIIFFIRFKIRIWSSIIGILLIGIFSFSG